MKIWVKFNASFQLCHPDFNFAPPPPPPRSREAGDAPAAISWQLCHVVSWLQWKRIPSKSSYDSVRTFGPDSDLSLKTFRA